MKKYSLFSLLVVMAATFSSCEAIGDIFQAGMWAGIIVVVVIVAVIIWIFNRLRK